MRNKKIDFDRLQMYFAEPYVIDVPSAKGTITLTQPSIGDMARIGEDKFYATLNIFIVNTTSYRLFLWENGIDWNDISDFDLFTLLYMGIDNDVAKLMFKDIDFDKFELYTKKLGDREERVLYNEELDLEINEEVYNIFSQYFMHVFNTFPEEKLTKDPILKKWFIQKDQRKKAIDEQKKEDGKDKQSSIVSLISGCINHPGFKYNVNELKDLTVYQFFDSVQRIQLYESCTSLMKGMYSGFMDTKSIKPEDYNFMKDV